jgi:ribonuclease Z
VVLQSWAAGRQTPLAVYGPDGVDAVTQGFMAAFALDASYRTAHHGAAFMPPSGAELTPVPVLTADANAVVTVFRRGELHVRAFRVDHGPVEPAYGYRIDYRGRSVVFSGDTVQQDILARVGERADVMVHEALAPHMMLAVADVLDASGDAQRAQLLRDTLNYHTTPVEAAETANAAHVGLLVYSHIVPSPPNAVAERVFLRGVGAVRDHDLVVGFDGLRVRLPVGSTEILQDDLR